MACMGEGTFLVIFWSSLASSVHQEMTFFRPWPKKGHFLVVCVGAKVVRDCRKPGKPATQTRTFGAACAAAFPYRMDLLLLSINVNKGFLPCQPRHPKQSLRESAKRFIHPSRRRCGQASRSVILCLLRWFLNSASGAPSWHRTSLSMTLGGCSSPQWVSTTRAICCCAHLTQRFPK